MKKILTAISVMAITLSTSSLYAQRGEGRMDPAVMKQRLIDSLQLSGVQADSVIAIGREFAPKMREIRMDQGMSEDDKKAKMKDISDVRNKRIQAVLGDDLYKKYHEWEERMRAQRGGMRGGNNN
ncbi:MAG TPA: hypothetical protein VKT28_04145 [Puia sp.]|nr:hypothetical protein [Puia sp.]